MSYFTDDTPHKSSTEPLIVDNNNLPAEKIGFWEQNYWRQQATMATETPASKDYNLEEAVRDRRKALEELTGGDVEGALKPFGYERPALTGEHYDPWEKAGHDAFEDAVKAYRETLPGDKKARLFVRDEAKERAQQIALERRKEALDKLKGAQYGWWGGLLGEMTAHSRDGLFIMTQMLLPQAVFSKLASRGVQLSMKGRVAAAAGIDATAAVAYEIPAQKLAVQPYKQELGLEHTDQEVINNIFAATIFSGIFGGTFEFAAGAFRRVATGEWTPQQARQHFAENYDKLTPEQKELVDMSLQAMEHERLNPYGPTDEGRAKFNEEAFKANQHAHSTGREVTDQEVKQAQETVALRDEEKEFLDIKESAEREAGLFDEPEIREEPEPLAPDQPELKDPLEAARPYLSDEAQQLIDTAFPPQVRIQMVDEIEAATGVRLQEPSPQDLTQTPEFKDRHKDLDYSITERENEIVLHKVVVPEKSRNKGAGANFMNDLVSHADKTGKRILLSPSGDFGGDVRRLKSFYKKYGFVENKGKNKDFTTQEGMIRNPQSTDQRIRQGLKSPDDPLADNVDKAIYAKILEDANRILPDEFKFETPETLGPKVAGKVNLDEKLVQVALDAPDFATKLRHEALHALRDRFKPDEWRALTRASKEIEFKGEQAYRDIGVKGDELEEERIANLIEYAYKGGDISSLEPKALGVIEKIVAWIKSLATTLKKPEYNKLQTILDDMESGVIAKREVPRGDLTKTANFKEWAGGSKIVKADEAENYKFTTGEPVTLEAYHGTPRDFSEPELRQYVGDGPKVLWLTPHKNYADGYANRGTRLTGETLPNAQTFELYASFKNPLVVDGERRMPHDLHTVFFNDEIASKLTQDIIEQRGKLNFSEAEISTLQELASNPKNFRTLVDEVDYYGADEFIKNYSDEAWDPEALIIAKTIKILGPDFDRIAKNAYGHDYTTSDIFASAKEAGHDGIIFKNMLDNEGTQTQIVVLDKTRIKSINNKGTFDPNDPRILYSLKENTPEEIAEKLEHLYARKSKIEGQVQGSFNELENLVTLAKHAIDQTETARHELIHALRANRLFTPNEWDTLMDAAQRGKWVDKHNIKDRYKDVKKGSDDELEPFLMEEAIAEEFAKWRAGKARVDKATQTIFEKIKDILDRIVKVLKSSGTDLPDDIFKQIEAGEFKERGYAQAFDDVQMQTAVRQAIADGATIKAEATDPIEDLEIEVDGVVYRPKELMEAANDDLAMAENIKLCAMMGR